MYPYEIQFAPAAAPLTESLKISNNNMRSQHVKRDQTRTVRGSTIDVNFKDLRYGCIFPLDWTHVPIPGMMEKLTIIVITYL